MSHKEGSLENAAFAALLATLAGLFVVTLFATDLGLATLA